MNNIKDLNWPVIFAWVVLTAIGLIAIFSATIGPVSQFLDSNIQNSFYKQSLFVLLSIGVLISIQFISPRTFVQLSYLFYVFGLALMVLTLAVGTEVNGAKSWLRLGPLN